MIHNNLISNMYISYMRAGPRSLASSSRSPAGRKRAERNLSRSRQLLRGDRAWGKHRQH